MVGILIVTHGEFAPGIVNGMELICGEQEALETISLFMSDDVEVFADCVRAAAARLDSGDGVIIMTDLLGGSPANVVCGFVVEEKQVEALAGINFPMLIEAIDSRDSLDVHELAKACLAAARAGIVDLKEQMLILEDEDED